jgi:hypothetical protein
MRFMYVLLVCCLLLAACSNGTKSNSSNVQVHDHKPTLDVKLDVSGNQVTVNVNTDMKISSEHYGMARDPGEGHVHMYLDNGEKIGVKQGQKVFTGLDKGKHTLKVSLHNNDHTPYDVTKTIEFEIK